MDKKIKMILLRITFVIMGISIFVVIKKVSSKSEVTPVLEHVDDSLIKEQDKITSTKTVDESENNNANNDSLNDNSSNKNNSDDSSLETDSKNKQEDNSDNKSKDDSDNKSKEDSDNKSKDSSDNKSNNKDDKTSSENDGKTITITETIKVKSNETYDGKGVKIIAKGMGDGSQDEGQKPIFRLEKGASLKNVIIGVPGCDGVHCYGDNTITNVVWEDIGEDALTVKGGKSADVGTVTINGGSAKYAKDKMFQINAPCTFVVNNFNGYDMGKFIRQNGGTDFNVNIYINSCTLDKVNNCIFKTDSKKTKLYYKDLTVTNCKKWWDVPDLSQIVE